MGTRLILAYVGFLVIGSPLTSAILAGAYPEDEAPTLRIARVIEVTDGSTEYMQPIWAPDGKKLAFTRGGFTGVYVRNADGSGPITEITSADYSGYRPVWTSDAKGIVIRTRTGVVGQSISYIDIETGEVKVQERALHPKQPERNAYGDVLIDLDGKTKVLDTAADSLEDIDSYFSAERPSSLDVRLDIDFRNKRMRVVEGDGLRSTEFPHQVFLASLSPKRDKVAFLQGNGNIYVSRLDGSSMVCVGYGARWDWSPDGQRLVYLGAIEQNEWTVTAADLFVVNADGTGQVNLSNTKDVVEDYPVWSPDGMSIACSTVDTGKILVVVLEEVR